MKQSSATKIPVLFQAPLIYFFFSLFFYLVACEDKESTTPEIQYGNMSDIDGNLYKTVLIGGQWWMAENLRVKHYRNGDPVTELIEDSLWNNSYAGYSIHPDATTSMGLLYNFAAIQHPGILAPQGWHIATDNDWKKLEESLGMESSAIQKTGWRGSTEGDALKAEGIDNWQRYDPVWATNTSGFTALSGSCRVFSGEYGYPGRLYTGFWWTSTPSVNDVSKAWYRYLDYKSSAVFRQVVDKHYGMGVRCVKDN